MWRLRCRGDSYVVGPLNIRCVRPNGVVGVISRRLPTPEPPLRLHRLLTPALSRDGRHLYPAFPYTAFTKMTDEDLTAVYAYLMAQPAVAHQGVDPTGVRDVVA